MNVWLLVLGIWSCWNIDVFKIFVSCLLGKIIVELAYLLPVAQFFGAGFWVLFFPLAQPFHIVYTVVAGWLGKFGKYEWKGRTVK
jgi:ABC-type lipoprotein release transport system permease subunit